MWTGGICWQSLTQNCALMLSFKRRISSNVAATSASSTLPRPVRTALHSSRRRHCKTCGLRALPSAAALIFIIPEPGGALGLSSSASKATLPKSCCLLLLPALCSDQQPQQGGFLAACAIRCSGAGLLRLHASDRAAPGSHPSAGMAPPHLKHCY